MPWFCDILRERSGQVSDADRKRIRIETTLSKDDVMQVYLLAGPRPSHRGFLFLSLLLLGVAAFATLGCGEAGQISEEAAPPALQGNEPLAAVAPGADTAISQPPVTPGTGDSELPKPLPAPENAVSLSPDYDIWVTKEKTEVIIDGAISLRFGVLEMFACTRNTKEHESIISANTQANIAHTALLAIGAKPGSPVRYDPEYTPPTGQEIEIEILWRGKDGKLLKARGQDWVREHSSGKPMKEPFVFAGSGTWVDEQTGEKIYMADGGDFICVSNFTSAMLDVPIESTQAAEGLLYEAYTERIPPLGTPVRMILRPKAGEEEDSEAEAENSKE